MTRPREVLTTLLAFLDSFWLEHGFGPTTRELQRGLGLSSTSVAWYQARAAARRGWLEWEPGKPRTMRLTSTGRVMVRGNGQDLATWLLRLEGLVAELDGGSRVSLEVLVTLSGSTIPLARFETNQWQRNRLDEEIHRVQRTHQACEDVLAENASG